MYCPNCGAENLDDARFCRKCGSKLKIERKTTYKTTVDETVNTQQTSQNSNDGSKKWIYIGCCCLSLIILWIVGTLGV
ncbi:MAG: zinc-ribbon domain-containing protein [Methanobrevibacter sp.]|uniref:zinc-ribbon domain-containing protein n=1 Tax=Methanobrevibacter sp. TaxID=66852 RepID=UPI0026E090E5|nr:zinc-ribbon domain-containing protein [Methanobrevibacter sp.]MDO5849456.1 zinc-ribbon domain-containing protein [Methanobrevibacter sp.]